MKIIEDSRAPNPRRVRIFLAEKDIEIPFEQIEIMKGEHKTPEFTSRNPMQRVPILVLESGTVISESVAICRYFEELEPEPPLMGKDPLDKARVEMWNRRMEFNLLYPIAQIFRHTHPAMAPWEVPQVPDWAEANRPRVSETLELLDKELAGRPFIAGPRFSIADITAKVAIDFMRPARIEWPEGLDNLRRWYEDVSARPSMKMPEKPAEKVKVEGH
jgi:glutathione S-transferase